MKKQYFFILLFTVISTSVLAVNTAGNAGSDMVRNIWTLVAIIIFGFFVYKHLKNTRRENEKSEAPKDKL